MKSGRIADPHGKTLFEHVHQTTSVWERMRGLLGSDQLGSQEGLLINHCNMVHTAFMKHPIDLVFLDKLGFISALYERLQPWRIAFCLKARMVLEVRTGMIGYHQLKKPMQLVWQE